MRSKRVFLYSSSGSSSFLSYTTKTYQDEALWVKETTDDKGIKVWEYTNKLGQPVLRKVQLADIPDPEKVGDYLYTYRVYDELQNLRFVIQPEGLKKIADASWAVAENIINEYCFRYRYDGRGRIIEKQLPGAEAIYLVYNERNLPVLSQDGWQRARGQWSFIKYDGLNRPVATGILMNRSNSTHDSYQESAMADIHFPYLVSSAGDHYLTQNYYDDYDFDDNGTADARYVPSGLTDEPEAAAFNHGRLTAVKTKIVGTDSWLRTKTFYDRQGRTIQVQRDNQLDGQDILTISYRNAVNSEVVQTKHLHTASCNR